MCELTATGFVAEAHEGRKALVSRLRRDVQLAVDGALHMHSSWVSALSSLTRAEESEVAMHAMRGDYCEAGRALGVAMRRIVTEHATDDAKESAYRTYGIDLDEVAP